jgi:RimJ/RimL family protein N-acetyltransferase
VLKEKKEEYSLAIKKENVMIGEVVLHNFDYFGGVEIGVRLFREYHGKGYAREAVSALKDYAFSILGAKTVKSRCYKENTPSKKLFTGLGLKTISEDERCYYFAIDKE